VGGAPAGRDSRSQTGSGILRGTKQAMGRELLTVIEQIGREKGIDTGRILEAVESALLTAAKKKYGAAENIQVRIDRKNGDVEAISLKKIVNEVTNPKSEVSLEEARKIDSEAELGDEIGAVSEL